MSDQPPLPAGDPGLPEPSTAQSGARSGLAQQAGLIFFGNLLTYAVTFFVRLVLIRHLAPAAWGQYGQLLLVFETAAPILLLGLPDSVLYFLPRLAARSDRARLVGQTLALLAGLGLMLSLGQAVASGVLADRLFGQPMLGPLLVLFAPYAVLMFLAAPINPLLVTLNRPGLVVVNTFGGAVMTAVGLMTALGLGGGSLSALVVGLVAGAAGQALLGLTLVSSQLRPTLVGGSAVSLRQQMAYAGPLGLTGLLGTLAYKTDNWFVSTNFTPTEFAFYNTGSQELPLVNQLNRAIFNVLVPELSRLHGAGERDALVALWQGAIRKSSLIYLPLFAFAWTVAEPLIRLLYGAAYGPSVPFFHLYLLLIPLRVAVYGTLLQATGQLRAIVWTSAGFLVANLIGNVIGLRLLGIYGPPLSTVVCTYGIAAVYLVLMRRRFGFPISSLFPFAVVGRTLTVAVAAALPVALGLHLWGDELPPLVQFGSAALAYGPLYLGLARLTNVIRDYDVALLRGAATNLATKLRHLIR